MAKKHKIITSDDATTIIIAGDRRNPEPTHLIVKFPGGYVEIARASDDSYWVHTHRYPEGCEEIGEAAGSIVGSRVDWAPDTWAGRSAPQLPEHEEIIGMSLRIAVASAQA